jgi:hypothetical protein
LYGGNMVSVSLTWWELGLVVGGSAIFVPIALIALGIGISVINDHRRQRRRQRERHRRPQLAIPYYVDESGVYDLARSLKIDLAIGREVTRQGKFAVSFQGFGGEGARSEMKRFAAGLDLNYLAERARETLDDDRLADGLGVAPEVRDEEVLAETADRLATRLGETSRTREILQELQSAYEQEKQETIAEDKRRELRTAAAASKLVLLRGQFTAAADRGVAAIRLTHFEAPSVRSYVPWELLEYSSAEDAARWEAHRLARETQAGDDFEDVASQIPIPAGVEIQVVFPDDEMFRPAGRERIGRGDSFYCRVLAHSPSFDSNSGTFTCSAYAVWGTTAPARPGTRRAGRALRLRQPGAVQLRLQAPDDDSQHVN